MPHLTPCTFFRVIGYSIIILLSALRFLPNENSLKSNQDRVF